MLCCVQAGERGDREVAFYAAIEQHRRAPAGAAGPDGGASIPGQGAAAHSPHDAGPAASIMQRFAQWVPRSCEWWSAEVPAAMSRCAPLLLASAWDATAEVQHHNRHTRHFMARCWAWVQLAVS